MASSSKVTVMNPTELTETTPTAPSEIVPASMRENCMNPSLDCSNDNDGKTELIQFTLKAGMSYPVFQTVNEGELHAPQFRSTVWVDGMNFTSQNTFNNVKASQKDAARIALEHIVRQVKEEGYNFIAQSLTFSKLTLNEYAAKLNVQLPTYNTFNTVKDDRVVPSFVCIIDFNGKRYTGDEAKTKKDAEKIAARAALLSIMGDDDPGLVLYQMLKSKMRLYHTNIPQNMQPICADPVPPIENTPHSSFAMDDQSKEVADLMVNGSNKIVIVNSPSIQQIPVGNDNNGIVIFVVKTPSIQLIPMDNASKEIVLVEKPTVQPTPEGNANNEIVIVKTPTVQPTPVGNASNEIIIVNTPTVQPTPVDNAINEIAIVETPTVQPILVGNDNNESVAVETPTLQRTHVGNGSNEIVDVETPTVQPTSAGNANNEIVVLKPPTIQPNPEASESLNESQQPGAALSVDNAMSAKRRRRLNYKANKRARMAAQLNS